MFVNAARSVAAIAGVCSGETSEQGCLAAARDQTTINALILLHDNCYDTGRALQEIVKNPLPLVIDKKWSEEETKKFVRGLKQYGKNFFKIRKEFLPQKETCDLVEFYYVWKKTESANSQRPRQRQRRPPTNILRVKKSKGNGGKQIRPTFNEFLELSSASENEVDECDGKDFSLYACHHCFTTKSKDWHHGGKDKLLLCTDCRNHCKKFNELPLIERTQSPPSFLFKSTGKESEDGGVKTRRSNNGQRKPLTPPVEGDKDGSSESSSSSLEENKKCIKKGKKRKSNHSDDVDDDSSLAKHKCSNKKPSAEEVSSESLGSSADSSNSSSPESNKCDLEEIPPLSMNSECDTAITAKITVDKSKADEHAMKSLAGCRRQLAEISGNDEESLHSPKLSIPDGLIATKHNPNSFATLKSCSVDPQFSATSQQCEGMRRVKEEPGEDENDQDQNIMAAVKDPEPKIDDSEHYRSKNAIFRRHWYRGELNSCSRTDLIFVPKPDSALARNRERQLKLQSDQQEMPIKKEPGLAAASKQQPATNRISGPSAREETMGSASFGSPVATFATPGPPSLTPATPAAKDQTPALQKLKEYAAMSTTNSVPPLTPFYPNMPPPLDPVLQSRILSGAFGTFEKERLEYELRERRKEQMQRSLFQPPVSISSYPFLSLPPQNMPSNVDPRSWPMLQNSGFPLSVSVMTGLGPNSQSVPPLVQTAIIDPAVAERILSSLSAERIHLERLYATNPNPLIRLELEKVTAQLAAVAGTQHHTHSHTHSHTHLHIHPTTGVPVLMEDLFESRWPPEALHASMFRPPNPNLDISSCGSLSALGSVPQIGLEHLAAERLHQLQQQELNRRMMIERDQFIAAQHQSIVQHNEMMRRLHNEANFASMQSPSVPLSTSDAPPMLPFDKR